MYAVPSAIIVGRAALGLYATLRWWCLNRGRNSGTCGVAVPGAICHDVVVAILAAGCKPVFCDIDIANGLVKDSEWMKARERGADVAMVVHLYGNPANSRAARTVFAPPDCLLIDDAAQALGARGTDGLAGARGDVGLLSFTKTKHLPLGNAALLFKDTECARGVEGVLATFTPEPTESRESLEVDFRLRLDAARTLLRRNGPEGADAFSGLLRGMEPTLRVPTNEHAAECLATGLKEYSSIAEARVSKGRLWGRLLSGTDLRAVGMGVGCVPWRYVCRLPGICWGEQHALAEEMRAADMHVSHWYLPAHWFIGPSVGALPGVERLSSEVFQFWVDESTTHESIVRSAEAVKQALACFARSEGRT